MQPHTHNTSMSSKHARPLAARWHVTRKCLVCVFVCECVVEIPIEISPLMNLWKFHQLHWKTSHEGIAGELVNRESSSSLVFTRPATISQLWAPSQPLEAPGGLWDWRRNPWRSVLYFNGLCYTCSPFKVESCHTVMRSSLYWKLSMSRTFPFTLNKGQWRCFWLVL